jgi:hypothetical protein
MLTMGMDVQMSSNTSKCRFNGNEEEQLTHRSWLRRLA